ncbi:hypothetical protein PMAYCL1PPCAC_27968, partial [Pristionchus mayeri]
IGQLSIMLDHHDPFHREIYRLLKHFNMLILDSRSYDSASFVITRTYLLQLANKCKSMTYLGRVVTPLDLFALYRAMLKRTVKIRCFM